MEITLAKIIFSFSRFWHLETDCIYVGSETQLVVSCSRKLKYVSDQFEAPNLLNRSSQHISKSGLPEGCGNVSTS